MAYFTVVPTAIRKSKVLTNNEKELYYEIFDRCNQAGLRYCTISNKELSKLFEVSETTVSMWISSLEEKKFINTYYVRKQHKRRLYPNIPGEPPIHDEAIPECYSEKQKMFHDAFPDRQIDLDLIPEFVDMKVLIACIQSSEFLSKAENMSLRSCVERYPLIIAGAYYKYKQKPGNTPMSTHKYSKEELAALWDKIDEVEI